MHATVNNLPLELLAHIFHLVRDAQPCAKRDYSAGSTETRQVYPTALSQVCSRWRNTAFSTPTLWSHIDISTSIPLNQLRLDGLIELHSTYARQIPLELHIFDPIGYSVSPFHTDGPLHKLIVTLASRSSSFNLDVGLPDSPDIHGPILSTFFKGFVPGRFTRLVMVAHHYHRHRSFIKAKDDPGDDGMDLDLPMEQLENILAGVSILHLDRLFPQWTSRAYHGLTELRLNEVFCSINESDLVRILRSSPTLRILELGLDIQDSLPMDAPITAIPLNSLEVVNVSELPCEQLAGLFRWFALGSKPLQFVIQRGMSEDLELKEQLGPFFSRSCIDQVYGRGLDFSHLVGLLESLPHLQELAVSWVRFNHSGPLKSEEIMPMVLDRRLKYLYVTNSSIHIEDLLALLSIPGCIMKTVVLERCRFYRNGFVLRNWEILLEEVKQEHPEVNFVIQYTKGPFPVDSWGAFAPTHKLDRDTHYE